MAPSESIMTTKDEDEEFDESKDQVENTEIDKETLIKEVSKQPSIWNSSHYDYKDVRKKRIAWNEIREIMEKEHSVIASVNELKIIWKNVREGYVRCKAKRDRLMKSEVKKTRLPSCNFFRELEFLSDPHIEVVVSSPEQLNVSNLFTTSFSTLSAIPEITVPVKESSSRKREFPSICEYDSTTASRKLDEKVENIEDKYVPKNEGANQLFCRSLAPLFDELTPEQNMLARIRIQQVLYDIKFEKK
ncbi:uncharacterized protein [Lepeophtheirus salmonis]|uniref:Putative LOC101744651 [Bombyx mori] n=1 Tax=Lepeophtheirus salmonis TaxID=72036 RepID=A0A0K2TCM1_LEPSM|nr:uncharacterized protein LOC121125824 [Lepeophtheirus salmonis]